MQKAISDMEKDQVLQQYQYFVGTQDTGVKKTPLDTGISALRSGENFFLLYLTHKGDTYVRISFSG